MAEGSDMEMIQFLEADKEQLYGSITQAGTPEQVQGVIEKELDRLLLRYNEMPIINAAYISLEFYEFQQFFNLANIKYANFCLGFIEEFRIWLLTEHQLSHNGAVKYLALLKKVVNRAVANNKMSFNPFATYRLERQTVSPDFLTEEELRKIINFNSPLPRLEQTRDMFLFACYTGLSYIDVKTLKPEHLERDKQGRIWIKKHRVKTGVLSRIPLLPSAKMLLDKYAGNETLMPIFSPKDINLFLKDIAILCNIDKRVTYHTARHTFASTVTLANNVSLIVVSKMLGHSNVRMTEHYAKLVDTCIGEEMDKLMNTYTGE
jgi:integrase